MQQSEPNDVSFLGYALLLLLFNSTFGVAAVDFLTKSVFNTNLHWLADVFLGLIVGEFAAAIAVIILIIKLFN